MLYMLELPVLNPYSNNEHYLKAYKFQGHLAQLELLFYKVLPLLPACLNLNTG